MVSADCRFCGRKVVPIRKAEAMKTLGIEERTFDGLIAAGQIHLIEMSGAEKLICRESVSAIA